MVFNLAKKMNSTLIYRVSTVAPIRVSDRGRQDEVFAAAQNFDVPDFLLLSWGRCRLPLDALFLPVFWARALSRDLAPAVVFFLFFTVSHSPTRCRLACYTPVHSNGTRT
jgi:hypothetical protein